MDGCESNDLSEDALPLPAMPELETQSGISATVSATSDIAYQLSENINQTEEMQDRQDSSDDQVLTKRPRLQTESGSGSVFSEISPPHDRWAFNLLIVNLSKNITEEDFRQMKEMYKGEIPRKLLNSFKTPMDLFDTMQKYYFLSPVNLLQIEGLFWNLGRHDLMDMVIDYCRKTKNVIYMQPASLTPVNGYTHVQFHVCGKNFNEMTKEELCYLRTVVANILLIPSSFVLIDGVNHSSSITVTMLVPSQYAKIMQTMLTAKEIDPSELLEFGVDFITIGEAVYPIAEIRKITTDPYPEQSETLVLVRLQKAKDTIANLEAEKLKHIDRIRKLETENLVLKAQYDTFRRSAKPKDLFPEAESMEEDSVVKAIDAGVPEALLKFSNKLEEMSKDNCNKTKVLELLEVHGTLIAVRCYQELSLLINKLVLQTQNLMFIQGTHVALQHFIGPDVARNETTPIKALKEISEKLSPDERCILEKEYNWTKHDREALQKSQMPFLLFLLVKKSGTGTVNTNEFLRKCLTKVNRPDLFLEFMEKTAKEVDLEEAASSSTSTSHGEVQTNRDTKMEEILKHVEKILDKVNKLDNKTHSVPELGIIAKQMKGAYPTWLYNLLYSDCKIQ